jgi:hypothetical protein
MSACTSGRPARRPCRIVFDRRPVVANRREDFNDDRAAPAGLDLVRHLAEDPPRAAGPEPLGLLVELGVLADTSAELLREAGARRIQSGGGIASMAPETCATVADLR